MEVVYWEQDVIDAVKLDFSARFGKEVQEIYLENENGALIAKVILK